MKYKCRNEIYMLFLYCETKIETKKNWSNVKNKKKISNDSLNLLYTITIAKLNVLKIILEFCAKKINLSRLG